MRTTMNYNITNHRDKLNTAVFIFVAMKSR